MSDDGRVVDVGAAAEVRHRVDRQLLLAATVAGQHLAHAAVRVPEVDEREPVLAEEAGQVPAPVGRDQAVVRLPAGVAEAPDPGLARVARVDDPDLSGVEQARDEALAGRVREADDLRRLPVRTGRRRDVGEELQRHGIEELDAAGRVVLCGDDAPVLAHRAADRVAGLHDPLRDAPLEQVDRGQAAVAAEHVRVASVARVDDRRVRQVAQAVDDAQRRARRGVDDLHAALGALDDHAQIAGAAQFGRAGGDRGGGRDRGCGDRGEDASNRDATARWHRLPR